MSLNSPRGLRQRIELRQSFLHPFTVGLADFRDSDPARGTVEQNGAEPPLELCDVLRDKCLGLPELLTSRREAPRLHDGEECADEVQAVQGCSAPRRFGSLRALSLERLESN